MKSHLPPPFSFEREVTLIEGIAERYYGYLLDESYKEDDGLTLAKFYTELFSISLTLDIIKTFRFLVKVYGSKLVFTSVLDLLSIDKINHDSIIRLLTAICKNRLLKEKESYVYESAMSNVESLEKFIKKSENRKTKLKIRSPFDE